MPTTTLLISTFDDIYEKVWNDQHALQQPTSTEGESTNSEGEEEEELTAADTILETNESSGDDMDSVATEEGSESDTEEDDEMKVVQAIDIVSLLQLQVCYIDTFRILCLDFRFRLRVDDVFVYGCECEGRGHTF